MNESKPPSARTRVPQADRGPTPNEERIADRAASSVDVDDVGEEFRHMTRLGAAIRGEGEVEPPHHERAADESDTTVESVPDDSGRLARLADRLTAVATGLRLDTASAVAKKILGHPAHPAVTDLPIGFFTSAWALDVIGGRAHARSAQRLTALGLLSAVPTVASGLGDASGVKGPTRRLVSAHVIANSTAIACFAASWLVGRRRRRPIALMLSTAGAAATAIGGHLGGELAFA